jgi:hypothetical protein
MSLQPSTTSRIRLGLLLGLVFTLGVVLVGLRFLGRGAEIATPVAKPTQAPPVKGQVKVNLRSSASLNLDESKNVRPDDSPELGSKNFKEVLQAKTAAKFRAMFEELGIADESQDAGVTKSAAMVLAKLAEEPRMVKLGEKLDFLDESWAEANQQERQVILDRTYAITDQLLIEFRAALSALR